MMLLFPHNSATNNTMISKNKKYLCKNIEKLIALWYVIIVGAKPAMRLINILSGEKYIKWIVTVIVNNS